MHKVILDTDILSEILKTKDSGLTRKAAEYQSEQGQFTISVLTVLEIVRGWHRRQREDRLEEFLKLVQSLEVLPVDAKCAEVAGRVEADLARSGLPIGRADSMIAATAMVHSLVLVTGNENHYRRIQTLGYSLRIENWRT